LGSKEPVTEDGAWKMGSGGRRLLKEMGMIRDNNLRDRSFPHCSPTSRRPMHTILTRICKYFIPTTARRISAWTRILEPKAGGSFFLVTACYELHPPTR